MASFLCHGFRYVAFYCAVISFPLSLILTISRAQKAMYVFGDSLVDVGNNNHLPLSVLRANLPYNGMDYQGGKPTGRFSNGKNAADFIAEKLGLPAVPPYLAHPNNVYVEGVSFASGGAGTVNTTNENLIEQTIPMAIQVGYFSTVRQGLLKQMGSAAVQEHLSKSIYLVVIGSNDIINYFQTGSKQSQKYSPQQYVTLMVSTLKDLLEGIYGLGARKFLVIGVPTIGCAPKQRLKSPVDECNEEVNNWSKKYNDELVQMLHILKSELREFQYSYFDTYSVLMGLIQNAATYGFKNAKGACCGAGKLRAQLPCTPVALFCLNRTDHIFWDIYHPTEAAARTFIDILFRGSGGYVSPITVQQLIVV